MYRVFEALDELGAIVEEARGVPMTAGCVVPRGDVLELLDDVKDSIPAELDDAQDVLDQRDKLVGDARDHAESAITEATSQADAMVSHARAEADRILSEAKSQADRMVAEAQAHSTDVVSEANADAQRTAAGAAREFEAVTGRARAEAARMIESGNSSYEKSVADGIAEQQRLVSETEVVAAAKSEADRIIDAAHAESDRLRGECDVYVDNKLADFEEVLTGTMRSVNRGRQQLRTGAGVHDYNEHPRAGMEFPTGVAV
ncbi:MULTISPECIES: DivIVA domain-containing protein [Williamsia]|uniref:DivIVA domain-containing protein n=1 Tax=Williamsia TaxID=85043 RepID=UPI00166914EE|nr:MULTISPECIES: DivIVA domain-containing protein [Williamsia]MBJ7287476.1 DivIVA domain-containing protein [Williamsia sp.]